MELPGSPGSSSPSDAADAGPASADAGPAAPPAHVKHLSETKIPDAAPPPTSFEKKRPVPDYDGRGAKPTTLGDVAIWVPRILASPFYLTSEYLIRLPIGGLITGIERDHLAQKAILIVTFGGKQNIGLVPTFFVDFGVLPSIGLYFFADDAFARYNDVRVHAGTWGPDWINIGVADRYHVSKNATAALRASWARRSDNPFFGLGPDSKQGYESRYASTTFDAGPEYDMRLRPGVFLHTAGGVRDTGFGEGSCCGVPSLQARIRSNQLEAPPRLYDGYTMGYSRASLTLDTRDPRPEPQSGFRLALSGQPAIDVSHRPGNSWLQYGATGGAFWDVTGKARVISLSASVLFVDPIKGSADQIPFSELVSFGGTNFMRGFLAGRLIDRSAVVATVGYEWPIWVFLDGTMQISAGNVFGAGLRDYESKKLRLSPGIGIRTNNSPDHQFEVITGFGTDTIENGARVTSFRLAFGATRGF